eukprot:5097080-Alexandrium_andersonii.AAC.1
MLDSPLDVLFAIRVCGRHAGVGRCQPLSSQNFEQRAHTACKCSLSGVDIFRAACRDSKSLGCCGAAAASAIAL